jgi:transcriptional regulator GlxA family with amidase domain
MGRSSLPNIDGTHQIFTEVNSLAKKMGMPPVFDVQLIGISNQISQRSGKFTIVSDCLIQDIKHTNLIIIPAMHGDLKVAIEANAEFLPWISEQYKTGTEVASLCIGVFFLAATRLLDGKKCTIYWGSVNYSRQMYPKVNVIDNKIITHEERIYTSGVAYSFVNLLVYIIEKYAGREIAIMIAKAFMIDIDRHSQSPFVMFQGQKDHNDEAVQKTQQYIE